MTTTKKPWHLLPAGAEKPLCGITKSVVLTDDLEKTTCGRCLRAACGRGLLDHGQLKCRLENRTALRTDKLIAEMKVPQAMSPDAVAANVAAGLPALDQGWHTPPPVTVAPAVQLPVALRNPKKHAVVGVVRTHLLNPDFVYAKSGKLHLITGTCSECRTAKRTIGPADAFQVRRCVPCQKKFVARRVAAARKARRVAARRS